jgi:hypothetical protein
MSVPNPRTIEFTPTNASPEASIHKTPSTGRTL